MGNHLSFLVYHHNGGGSSFTVAQYDLESKKLPEATQEANGSICLQGVNFVFNNSPVKEVGWLKGKLSNEEWVAAVTATHKACKETNKKFTELTCAACDTILDGVRLNVEKAITNLNTQYAAKGVKFSVTVDGPHLDEHKDQCYNLKTSLHATIA